MLTLKNIWPSIVRTLVPAIVTYLLSIPLVPRIFDWLGIGQDDRNAWTARAITWVLFAVYYIASRFLEEHKSAFGWLLGLAKAPAYPVQGS
jgi:ABC-type dipeptide/oligopeptide/nickel transport system permease component